MEWVDFLSNFVYKLVLIKNVSINDHLDLPYHRGLPKKQPLDAGLSHLIIYTHIFMSCKDVL